MFLNRRMKEGSVKLFGFASQSFYLRMYVRVSAHKADVVVHSLPSLVLSSESLDSCQACEFYCESGEVPPLLPLP